jgi:hypothetical protein
MKKIWLVLALALAVVTGSYGAAVASANHAHSGKGHGTVHGIVSNPLSTDSITLTRLHACDTVGPISVTGTTKVRVNGKKSTFDKVTLGMVANVKTAKDGTAKSIKARSFRKHNLLIGKVDTVGADSLTFTLKRTCVQETVSVNGDTKIQIGDKSGTLDQIGEHYRVVVKLRSDGTTAKWIKARAPKS